MTGLESTCHAHLIKGKTHCPDCGASTVATLLEDNHGEFDDNYYYQVNCDSCSITPTAIDTVDVTEYGFVAYHIQIRVTG